MIRTQIQLTDEQLHKLRRAAREHGVSVAEIVRRCIDRAIDEEIPGRRNDYARAARLVGAFQDREGARDVSARHEDYLEQGIE
jgi:hypothetical protein